MIGFTPIPSLVGGLIIGLAAALFMWSNGRVTGISGIIGGLLPPHANDMAWRLAVVVGLVLGGFSGKWLGFAPEMISISQSWPLLIVGGGLVGLGTNLGSGCTSGHGVCGIARRSKRSLVATMVFMGAAVLSATILRQVLGG
ncbi:MAG: hypothetical protein A3G18_04985 [Rhodospirillales bacterium RIFCSPLOWO2_12_FULL_58_28]|nr:MAG: hypothetical protein A3H92_03835 [Rhodospirillales bacterium RIFCSPLOWO2_02_FULL_58_16]OHC78268.1 MAG: hypothetical protein A3G18_04985 [Rhodospirillales bacterium RIFCSPLOWO2_12_FULL_58_28]